MRGQKSAAEIRKGERPVMILSEADVERFTEPKELIGGLLEGFRQVARGEMQIPPRPEINIPGKGFMLSMPAWLPGGPIMVKMVNVFEGNNLIDLPNHLATIVLFDQDTGNTLCVMDGTYVTGIRTAASAVVSVKVLARAQAKVATVVGAGVQGREHLRLLPLVKDFEKIYVSSLVHEDAVRLADMCSIAEATDDLEAAIRQSDVVCLATHSYQPVIESSWVQDGTHVSSVGYAPPNGELSVELIARGRLFVEDLCAFEPPPVGCAELVGIAPASGLVIGKELLKADRLRLSDTEITIYKAMGIAMEDLVAANNVYQRAKRADHSITAVF
ncbi:ornithine cyclodeaminase family protein [uncultured Roseibium sp.]|uniref:ornithine cyclodeaminase family protein n=1 Tax=uncultured Roseibium sp. TaxID=1936171 RepID=UPI002611F05B|nr:ornithine cyclodeaminase family protein [uncultured Roseibium sp.]